MNARRRAFTRCRGFACLAAVLLLGVLAAPETLAQATPSQNEKFGFDTWTDNWGPWTRSGLLAITNCFHATNHVWSGAHWLRFDCALSGAPSRTGGVAIVDLMEYRPFAITVPVDLNGKSFSWYEECNGPADKAAGTHPGYTNRTRIFLQDEFGRGFYNAWYNLPTGFVGVDAAITVSTSAPSGGSVDSGFDPSKVRYIGYEIQQPAGSTSTFNGPLYLDQVRFAAPPAAFAAPTNQKYGFAADAEGFTYSTWSNASDGTLAITNCYPAASGPSNAAGCLAMDVRLDATNAWYDAGEVSVDLRFYAPPALSAPMDLDRVRVGTWVYCPGGLRGQENAINGIQLFCKDSNWRSYYGPWEDITTGCWFSVSMTPSTNAPRYGYKDAGFDASQVIMLGFKVGTAGGSTSKYDGKLYLDGVGFSTAADQVNTNEIRYSFEPNKEGWAAETYGSITGITAVSQSSTNALAGSRSLRMDVRIVNAGTNRTQGAAKVDSRWYPPAVIRTPFDLLGDTVSAYVYCPAGSQSTNPATPNQVRIYVNDGTWNSQYGDFATMRDGQWVKVSVLPTDAGGFQATNIIAMGIDISMAGTYTNALYLDALGFPAEIPAITNSQHVYDFEAAGQLEYWKWDTNPDGWDAKAWTNTYYATNWGVNGTVALAGDAQFSLGVDEVVTNGGVVTTNVDVMRKAVFEIGYQPALNLSTKDHRRILAKIKFEPPVEGLLSFDASMNVFDKITDQWYKKAFLVGGYDWNILQFDLDNPADYSTNDTPPGPMDPSAIGFLTIQIYANVAWTGTVYLDDVIVGGRETGTNFNRLATGFVTAQGPKFVLDGTNFFFAGANIEYLQTESDATAEECLDWAATNHLQMVRTWAMHEGKPYSYQPLRGVWNELMFEHLDRIIAMAGHRNIRLLLGLCDNWAHNGGMFQYVHWAVKEHPESVNTNFNKEGVEYHDQFWTNQYCRQWYKDYVTKLLTRTNTITGVVYRDDPTIFGFEIVNEPRCESDFTGKTVHDWLHEMSDFVRSIDGNHLLGPGEEGGYVNTYDFADTVPWEVYPDNYYHYATYAVGSSTCDLYGCGRGHGVDYISDAKSSATYVEWQGGFYTNRDPVAGEWRAGNSNISFCTARIYVDQKEYNVWRTNLNSADQRIEWLNDHWYDAHQAIGKPMILDEFGIHANGWIFNGSYGQVQLVRTPSYSQEDRVDIFDLYYRFIENSGVAGSFFWNFGFDGMWNDPFWTCEEVGPWVPQTADGSATGITASTNFVLEGIYGLELSFNVTNPSANKAIYVLPTNAMWVLRVDNASTNEPPTRGVNRGKFFWNVYNPLATNITCALALRGTPNGYWCESPQQNVTAGWNRILFDLSAGSWAWVSNGWVNDEYLIRIPSDTGTNVLEDVRDVNLVFYNLPSGPGALYIDDIEIKRDDGFVVYADDPVNPVIRAHADRMAARNVATNNPANHAPAASNLVVVADAFKATNVTLAASDADPADAVSFRIIQRPTNGWVFGMPPTNVVYKSMPGTTGGDTFTYKAHDGMADSAEAVVTIHVGSTDTDGDSLPDDWEFSHFPKQVQYWPYDGDNLTNLWTLWDWDGDGYDDWHEYGAGTDPKDGASYLYVAATGRTEFVVSWPSIDGKVYDVQRSTNLVTGFEPLWTNIAALPPTNTRTDTTAASSMYLYRVRVQ